MSNVPQLQTHAVAALLDGAECGTPWRMTPLAGGANNRVYRIDAGGRTLVLKQYFHAPEDTRDRLGAEFALSSFAWRNGVLCLPKPIAADFERRLGLYSFVDGRRLQAGEVDDAAVEQALAFALALDGLHERDDSHTLPTGSEAVFRLADHLALVEQRVRRLGRIDVGDTLQADAARLVSQSLMPAWDRIAARARLEAARAGIALDEELPMAERTISASDFGFHNALRAADGTIRFIDFEYAGWDDPAKLVCDFFNQIAVPVPRKFYARFADRLAAARPRAGLHRKRFDLLLPVYGVKWVCIMLNDFMPAGEKRRRFAAGEDRRALQLDKARAALAALEG
ncbi:MAG TPA: aminoglycoside phosphotransferase family protein [Alphaproteobacteria bacterium]|nr:aminoglycoside phosphotransferase family protein [Alphaproteobacteria bacterium]